MGELIIVMVSGAFLWWFLFVRDTGEWNSSRQQPPPPKREPPPGYQPFSKSHLKPLDYNPFSNKTTPLGGDEDAD
jgi:hypothetical protein